MEVRTVSRGKSAIHAASTYPVLSRLVDKKRKVLGMKEDQLYDVVAAAMYASEAPKLEDSKKLEEKVKKATSENITNYRDWMERHQHDHDYSSQDSCATEIEQLLTGKDDLQQVESNLSSSRLEDIRRMRK
jgi:hypothetical protein